MKFLKICALLVVGCVVGFYAGRDYEASNGQSYEDASKMSDFIRCYEDMASDDSLFLELHNEFLDNVKLNYYVYSY
jgi:uncharacterized protein (UPF0333 family)